MAMSSWVLHVRFSAVPSSLFAQSSTTEGRLDSEYNVARKSRNKDGMHFCEQ